ncbi:MAG TPA: trehalase family glycosidase [Acidimicrobiia bacterium]
MPLDRGELLQRAQAVLAANQRGAYTCPSTTLYPHQWLWDSCFTAIGLARYDAPRAAAEMRSLFRGQWSNGMLPHMIFGEHSTDLGSKQIWQSRRHPLAPRDVDTSCITQPPLAAVAVWRVGRALADAEREAFWTELFPKVVAYHRWLYDERDPEGTGLVTLIHPWECGLDTTPPWMRALQDMPLPPWLDVGLKLRAARLVRLFRRDTHYLPANERSSDDDGLRMLVLATHARGHDFALASMPPGDSVLIQDLGFNAMLTFANAALGHIADALGAAIDSSLAAPMQRTARALENLWHDETSQYYSRDVTAARLLELPTVATFLPLLSEELPPHRVEQLVALLDDTTSYALPHPVPSVPRNSEEFQELRYWKGPSWVNMNWLIREGLRIHGHDDAAERLRDATLTMVGQAGCFEYFSPLTGDGHGAPDFSWTAALTVDLLHATDAF